MSAEKSTTPTTTDNNLSPSMKWYENSNFCLISKGSCLKRKNATFTSLNIINFCIFYELDTWSQDLNSDYTLKNYLLGRFKLAKNAHIHKHVYTVYAIGFDSRSEFSLPDGSVGKYIMNFGVDMNSSEHIDNKKKKILIQGKGPT